MASRQQWLLSLVFAAIAANGLELGEPVRTGESITASRRHLTCGYKPDCCKVYDWSYCYCKEYEYGYYYADGHCVHKHQEGYDDDDAYEVVGDIIDTVFDIIAGDDYECPDCCKVCDYDGKSCKSYKHGWFLDGGRCYYRDDFKCPHCCKWCDSKARKCASYKDGWEYRHGECRHKVSKPAVVTVTATATADANCHGYGCSTTTHTSTTTTSASSYSSSSSGK
eukprot:evm.model.scf_1623.1 EVM.evm.TU.scf_1623.1   scf_1623:4282-6194(-)